MKKATTLLALAILGVCAFAAVAGAALRVPQVAMDPFPLQGYLNGVGESINVATDQQNVQTFQKTVSGNSTFTLMIEVASYANNNTIGLYDASQAFPTLAPIFQGTAVGGWFAIATFLGSGDVVVNVFDNNAILQTSTTYPGINGTNFGFYLSGPGGTFYTQDFRNGGGDPQALVYAGTGVNSGQWWLAIEDLPYDTSDKDFNDAVLFLESVAPTPAHGTSWGAIKARFR